MQKSSLLYSAAVFCNISLQRRIKYVNKRKGCVR